MRGQSNTAGRDSLEELGIDATDMQAMGMLTYCLYVFHPEVLLVNTEGAFT